LYTSPIDDLGPFPFDRLDTTFFFRVGPTDSTGTATWTSGSTTYSVRLTLQKDTGVLSSNGVGWTGYPWDSQYYLRSFTFSPYNGPYLSHPLTVSVTSLVGIPKDTTLILENTGVDTLRIQSLTSSDPSLVVSLSADVIPPFKPVSALVRYTSFSPGPKAVYFRIGSNAVSSSDTVALTFSNSIAGATAFDTLEFRFISVNVLWKYKDAPLAITNIGNAPLTFDSVRSTNADFGLLVDMSSLAPGGIRNCTVRYTPTPPFFVQEHGEILLYTSSLWGPDTIHVSGDAWGARFSFDPTSIDFGRVRVGESADTTVEILYQGWAYLGLRRDGATDPSFAGVGNFSISCQGCGSMTDTLRFTPTSVGPAQGFLVYVSNNGTTVGTDTIWLAGTGVRSLELPTRFALSYNFPNPFNPVTTLEFDVPVASLVSLKVFDLLGREVAVLANSIMEQGNYSTTFDGTGLASGVYLARMEAGKFVQVRKLLLLR
jgi:hypothetical protein